MSLTLNDFHICHIRVQFINLFWFDFTMFYFSPPKPNFQFHVGEAKHVYRKLRCRSICEVWVQSFVQPVRAFSSTTGKACVLNHCHTAHGKGIFKFLSVTCVIFLTMKSLQSTLELLMKKRKSLWTAYVFHAHLSFFVI